MPLSCGAPMDRQALIRNISFPVLDGLRFYAALLVFLVHSIGALVTEYIVAEH